MERRINDLSMTGHPMECAKILVEDYLYKDPTIKKNNKIKENGHKLHLHVDEKNNSVHIHVYEGEKNIKMHMDLEEAFSQAKKLLNIS